MRDDGGSNNEDGTPPTNAPKKIPRVRRRRSDSLDPSPAGATFVKRGASQASKRGQLSEPQQAKLASICDQLLSTSRGEDNEGTKGSEARRTSVSERASTPFMSRGGAFGNETSKGPKDRQSSASRRASTPFLSRGNAFGNQETQGSKDSHISLSRRASTPILSRGAIFGDQGTQGSQDSQTSASRSVSVPLLRRSSSVGNQRTWSRRGRRTSVSERAKASFFSRGGPFGKQETQGFADLQTSVSKQARALSLSRKDSAKHLPLPKPARASSSLEDWKTWDEAKGVHNLNKAVMAAAERLAPSRSEELIEQLRWENRVIVSTTPEPPHVYDKRVEREAERARIKAGQAVMDSRSGEEGGGPGDRPLTVRNP